MAKKCISYSTIIKRSRCLNTVVSEQQTLNADKRFTNLKLQLENLTDGSVNPSVKKSLQSFMESICDTINANNHYREPLFFIEKFNEIDDRISNEILYNYTTRVLPYVKDLSMMKETIERYNLYDEQKIKILETVSQYIVADRILKNHDMLSKRFNIELEVSKIKSKGLKSIVESCCTMIDTYTIKSYQKLNLCIEELSYLFGKNNIDYDPRDLAAYVTEYFILSNPILSASDLKGYRTALKESYCLTEEDLAKVQYIYWDDNNIEFVTVDNEYTSIKKEIDKFLRCPEKDARAVETCINNALNNNTKLDIITNFDKLLWLIWDVQKSGICDQEKWFAKNTEGNLDRLVRRIEDSISMSSTDSFTRDDISLLIENIKKFKSIIVVNVDDNYEYTVMVSVFKSKIDELIEKLKHLKNLVYSKNNLESIEFVNSESADIIPLQEFKIFKFHNLVNASLNLDKYLKIKAKKIYDKGNKKIRHIVRRVKDVLFGESTNIYSLIGEDSKVDFCVAQYYIDEYYLNEIHEFFDEVCKEYNYQLAINGNFTSKAYYIINPGILEVHLKDSTPITLEESDWKNINESNNEELDVYIDEFATLQSVIESYENFCSEYELESIQDKIARFSENKNLTLDHYQVALEALSLLNVTKEDIELFTEKFSNYRYNTAVLESVITESDYEKELNGIKELSNTWNHEDCVPLDIQWEAYQILCAVLEDAPTVKKPEVKKTKVGVNKDSSSNKATKPLDLNNKSKNKEETKELTPEQEEEFKKNPFKGININSIRLYLEGLKGKMKDMSQKEKEISRNLDNNFRRFVKAMKDALISDRREAIIKGSVIPSFSKCVKIAIGLAGVGFISGNPLVPILIALGGFAMSKKLTKQERLLLLDEIETELEVVEKEIAIADSKNQIKKYRALLKYKKDLQRQYQRIKYNVRVGKDIMANSTAGIKSNLN